VLASGDPTFYGIGATLARVAPALVPRIIPNVSSVSLACARLVWSQPDVEVISLVGRPVELVRPAIGPGRRLLVLVGDVEDPARVAGLLRERGFGGSRLTALSNLGGDDEQRFDGLADIWPAAPLAPQAPPATSRDHAISGDHAIFRDHAISGDAPSAGAGESPSTNAGTPSLTVLGIECVAGPDALRLSRSPGLPDAVYENDGQLTKRHVRAITLSSLAPSPGELLWDVGGGAGSIGIEWMRHHPSCRAISIERDPERVARIRRNAAALGVPGLDVIEGSAPSVLTDLATPDAIFIGGGAGGDTLIDACWEVLPPSGRIVVNVTTLESEQAVAAARARYGGELTRIEITRAAPIGRYTGWRPAMPVTQWVAVR
jgi:precorrin-6Y C5,15-methyltransferase (decarboxylating)